MATAEQKDNNILLGTRIRSLRIEKGFSLKDFANSVNISPSYMSQIENGKINFSVALTKKICEALEISMIELLDDSYAGDYKLIEQKNLHWFQEGKSKKIYTAPIFDDKETMSVFVMSLNMNSKSETRKGFHGEEITIILKGTVAIHFDDEDPVIMSQGDIISYPAEIPHFWSNRLQEPAKILIIGESQER